MIIFSLRGFQLIFSAFYKTTLSWCSRYSPGFQPAISSTAFPVKNPQSVPTRQGTCSSPYTGHGTGSSNLYSSPENDHNLHNSSFNCLTPSSDLSPSPDAQVRHWFIYCSMEEFFVQFFSGLECVGHSFSQVAHFVFMGNVCI